MRLRWTFRFRFIAFLMPVLLLANAVTYAGTTGLGGSGDPSCETNGVVFLDPQPLMDAVLEATQDSPVALDYSRTAAARIDGMTVVRVPGPDYGTQWCTLRTTGQ